MKISVLRGSGWIGLDVEGSMKRTFQPKKRQRTREHGFMKRMSSRSGRKLLKARRRKGRAKLTNV